MAMANVEMLNGRLVLTFSEEGQRELELVEGSTLALHRTGRGLSVQRPRYKLEDLLAQCDYSLPMDEEERDWIDAPAVGRELI